MTLTRRLIIMDPIHQREMTLTLKTHNNGPYVRGKMTLTLRLMIMDPTSEGDDSHTKTHNSGPYIRGR